MNTAAAASTGGAGSAILGFLVIIVALAAYWAPSIVAYFRRSSIPNLGSILVINGLLGWTFIGWVVALAMAVRSPAQLPQHAGGNWKASS